MSETQAKLAAAVADAKSNLQDEAEAGTAAQLLSVLEHSVDHLIAAAGDLHPDIPAIEAELKPAVSELVGFVVDLLPGSMWISFLAPRIEDVVNHAIDTGLRKAFPAAA